MIKACISCLWILMLPLLLVSCGTTGNDLPCYTFSNAKGKDRLAVSRQRKDQNNRIPKRKAARLNGMVELPAGKGLYPEPPKPERRPPAIIHFH